MSTYLLINLLTIIFPLILSFDKKVAYYKNILPVSISILIVGTVYIFWDSIAVKRGDWSFNPDFVTNISLFGLPVDEILFFVTVPYSCIFIYEVIKNYSNEKIFGSGKIIISLLTLILITLAFIYQDQYYTFTVLLFTISFFIVALFFFSSLLKSRVYWFTIIISYLPFIIVNYFLTSLPVVEYNNKAILGIRIITIPMEDFFYSYSLISFWILVYLKSRKFILLKSSHGKYVK